MFKFKLSIILTVVKRLVVSVLAIVIILLLRRLIVISLIIKIVILLVLLIRHFFHLFSQIVSAKRDFIFKKQNRKQVLSVLKIFDFFINNSLLLPRRSSGDGRKRGKPEELCCPLRDVRSCGTPTWSFRPFQIPAASLHC